MEETINKLFVHPFYIAGMKVGDWFLGCRQCCQQYPVRSLGPIKCSVCDGEMRKYTVTDEDVKGRFTLGNGGSITAS